ncbi:MAG: DUF2332 domain-containing protein [Candidatus Dormibacteria bacterium]
MTSAGTYRCTNKRTPSTATWSISCAATADVLALISRIHEAREAGDARGAVVGELEYQAAGCAAIGSPLYGHLLGRLADDARSGGISWRVLEVHADEPPLTALGLRLMAAVHRLVLTGSAPQLRRHYPSAGGDLGVEGSWEAFRAVLEEHVDEVRDGVSRPCQTNEPGRAAALLGGFLSVSRHTGMPLRILEVGASAGLNLRWDHFRYVDGVVAWGPPGSPVVLDGVFEAAPPMHVPAVVVDRRGCDPLPQDPLSQETALNLRASAWPDQLERFAALDGALALARQVPVVIDRAEGQDWLKDQLATARDGVATVVYHSIVMQYMTEAARREMRDVLVAAGERATAKTPLAWLSMEPGGAGRAHVNLVTWPGGEQQLVAESGYHGRPVRWLEVPRPLDLGRGAY